MKRHQDHKKIILVGQAGSGKTHLAELFDRFGFRPHLSCTTRKMRVGEVHMEHYNFMSTLKFLWWKLLGRFWETKKFNGWRYGTLKTEWNSADLFIFTPSGCKDISAEERKDCLVVFLHIQEPIRRKRLMERSDADKVERRLAADREDFMHFDDYDLVIRDPYFDVYDTFMEITLMAGK